MTENPKTNPTGSWQLSIEIRETNTMVAHLEIVDNRQIMKIYEGAIAETSLAKCNVTDVEELREYMGEPGNMEFSQVEQSITVYALSRFKEKINKI
jgi:hypothetical protein